MPRLPNVKWRRMTQPEYGDVETWYARYRGWSLYAGKCRRDGTWHASLHRFIDGGAGMACCKQDYARLEGAQNAAEFYAEHGRFPHADHVEVAP